MTARRTVGPAVIGADRGTHPITAFEEQHMPDTNPQAAEVRVARHLAANDYLTPGDTADDAWWDSRIPKFRADYLAYAREVIAIVQPDAAAPSAPADQAASTAPLACGLPHVQGRCPACSTAGLFLGSGGYVTCSSVDCPEPDAATTVLEHRADELRRMADEAQQPETQADGWHLTPQTLDLFVRALVNEVDYDIHKGYECGEEDGEDHYPELVAEAAEMLNAITAEQPAAVSQPDGEA